MFIGFTQGLRINERVDFPDFDDIVYVCSKHVSDDNGKSWYSLRKEISLSEAQLIEQIDKDVHVFSELYHLTSFITQLEKNNNAIQYQ